MHPAQQLIEELQIHNLPHNADGSFNITAKQRDAIELVLSQQAEQGTIPYIRQEYDYQSKELDDIGFTNNIIFEQRINTLIALYKQLLSQQQAVVAQTDEEAAKEYADRQFTKPYEEMKDADQNAWIAFYEGYLAGLQAGRAQLSKEKENLRNWFVQEIENLKKVNEEARQQLLKEIEGLKRWKAEVLAVMPDMHAIGKALKVPLGQSIHDKILPAIQQLSKEQGMRWVKCSERLPVMKQVCAKWNDTEDSTMIGKLSSTNGEHAHIAFQDGMGISFMKSDQIAKDIYWLDESADHSKEQQ